MDKFYQTLINTEDLFSLYNDTGVVIFDCTFYLDNPSKGRQEYLKSHIHGAYYLDIQHDLSSPVLKGITGRHPLPHPEILVSTLRASGLENNRQVIVYDQSNGTYAARAWWLLRWLGHDNVALLNGGFKAWNSAQGPVDNQWYLPKGGNFKSHIRDHLVVEMKDLTREQHLIDSRDYKRYTGEFEPIDPVAGHIPRAVCIPFMENTDANGIWKSADELKKRFDEIPEHDTPVFYCGSGVTACHNILAFKIATGRDAKLYAGSWSEWINYNVVQ